MPFSPCPVDSACVPAREGRCGLCVGSPCTVLICKKLCLRTICKKTPCESSLCQRVVLVWLMQEPLSLLLTATPTLMCLRDCLSRVVHQEQVICGKQSRKSRPWLGYPSTLLQHPLLYDSLSMQLSIWLSVSIPLNLPQDPMALLISLRK